MDRQEIDTIPIMSSQLSILQRWSQDEELPVSWRWWKIPSNRSLVIVFEVELFYGDLLEGVFTGHFHNEDTEVHAWSEIEGIRLYYWL